MRILMLGWEYPPHIAGGLGIACEGLTRALARQELEIHFIVPQLFGDEDAEHMVLQEPHRRRVPALAKQELTSEEYSLFGEDEAGGSPLRIPALLKPYWNEEDFEYYLSTRSDLKETFQQLADLGSGFFEEETESTEGGAVKKKSGYGPDIFQEIGRFTARVLQSVLPSVGTTKEYDLIHAHDWITFPAGVSLARELQIPLITHVHSLEYDRSGGHHGSERIRGIERLGVTHATKVIAVSHYTKSIIHREHSIPKEKIAVVHNGIYSKEVRNHYSTQWKGKRKVVLFLGRITIQKGPDYFVQAAKRVVEHIPEVLFVMAGTGDMLGKMIRLTHELGISENFHFTGFLKEHEVEQMFSAADLYVMPSVSEPFGISALEAIDFNTPSLISKQSGVAEVLAHSLKFDFWDRDRLSDLIINGLLHEELRKDMVLMAREELKRLRWDTAASKTRELYYDVLS
ncbi:glycosyltransferase [bacterium]|nr:glycosyltransferase [bacterium]